MNYDFQYPFPQLQLNVQVVSLNQGYSLLKETDVTD